MTEEMSERLDAVLSPRIRELSVEEYNELRAKLVEAALAAAPMPQLDGPDDPHTPLCPTCGRVTEACPECGMSITTAAPGTLPEEPSDEAKNALREFLIILGARATRPHDFQLHNMLRAVYKAEHAADRQKGEQ